MNITIQDIIGIVGFILIIIAYLLLQMEKIRSDSYKYLILNILGSLLIIYSLFYRWNISAFLIEFFWLIISLYGLIKVYLKKLTN